MVLPATTNAQLKASFPCRSGLIDSLEDTVMSLQGGSCLLSVYGPPSAGKTAIVRSALQSWGVRHAYADCLACPTPRQLLHALVPQFKPGARRTRDEGFVLPSDCDSIAELLIALPSLLQGAGASAWLVLDNADRLAGTDILTGLTRAGEACDVALSLLLITRQPWSNAQFATLSCGLMEPLQLELEAYNSDQLTEIILHRGVVHQGTTDEDRALLKAFLTAFVPAFTRATCDLLEVEAAVGQLFPVYRAPLASGRALKPAQLYARAGPAIQSAIAERGAAVPEQAAEASGAGPVTVMHRQQLALQLPYISKYLILAAYIASRNKSTADRAVFDPGFRQRVKRGAQSHDRMVEAAQEAALKGPSPFPLERLLHIFFAIYGAHEAAEDAGADGRGGKSALADMLSADVLMALSSLVTLRMLSAVGDDVLDPGTLFHCTVDQGLVQGLASNLSLTLSDYIKLA